MALAIERLGSWIRTRNVLVSTLIMHRQMLEHTAESSDPESRFAQLNNGAEQTLRNIEAHSVYALRVINDEIGASNLIGQISDAAAKAKKEADRIKAAAKTIEELAALVDQGTEIIGLFSGLIAL
jgi:archaellum component FlaC